MHKRTFSVAFKKEVVTYMEQGNSCYAAKVFYEDRDKSKYDQSMFQQWFKKKEKNTTRKFK